MLRFGIFFIFLNLTILTRSETQRTPIEIGRFYQIQSSDGSVLTIGGGKSRDVRVVTEVIQGTSPRQKFVIGPGQTHEIRPEAQNAVSSLCLDLDIQTGLLFQQLRRIFYPRNQWWKIVLLENEKYVIQNDRTGHCLTSDGINTQVFAGICNLSNTNQTWVFNPV